MFERLKEYLKFGAGKPTGTIWAMERAYFELRRRYPGKEEYAYLRLTLQSRYPGKPNEVVQLASECHDLEDLIVKAIAMDFGHAVAVKARMNGLWNLPPCSRCRKYRALSMTDALCYGCRKYAGFAACTKCHLYWDDAPGHCQQCGSKLWKITDGPGVAMIPLGG
jgi:primosomal protein N'